MTEETLRKHLPYMIAFVEGKTIQYLPDNYGIDTWTDCDGMPMWAPQSNYRIKPTPSLVPWTQEDVPPVCWLTHNNREYYAVTAIYNASVSSHSHGNISYPTLLLEWKHSTDLRTWKPCGREAEIMQEIDKENDDLFDQIKSLETQIEETKSTRTPNPTEDRRPQFQRISLITTTR
jgi:hypothetical protein